MNGLDRTKAPEEVLVWITDEVKKMRRERLSSTERQALVLEDQREESELQGYVVEAIAADLTSMVPETGTSSMDGDDTKVPVTTPVGRQSGMSADA